MANRTEWSRQPTMTLSRAKKRTATIADNNMEPGQAMPNSRIHEYLPSFPSQPLSILLGRPTRRRLCTAVIQFVLIVA